jgi:hypothetical protein
VSSDTPDRDTPDRDTPDRDTPDRDTPDRDTPDRATPDRGALGPLEFEQPSGPGRYRKVRAPTNRLLDDDVAADRPLTAVVEVTKPGYRPSGVDVRAVITDTLFTAVVRPSALAGLDQDPHVVSVELGSRLDPG